MTRRDAVVCVRNLSGLGNSRCSPATLCSAWSPFSGSGALSPRTSVTRDHRCSLWRSATGFRRHRCWWSGLRPVWLSRHREGREEEEKGLSLPPSPRLVLEGRGGYLDAPPVRGPRRCGTDRPQNVHRATRSAPPRYHTTYPHLGAVSIPCCAYPLHPLCQDLSSKAPWM